jgi:predicted transcriptional regulator
MRSISFRIEESLLRRLDAGADVVKLGRSHVLRALVAEYLRLSTRRRIAEAYRRGYGAGEALGSDWAGWERAGSRLEK